MLATKLKRICMGCVMTIQETVANAMQAHLPGPSSGALPLQTTR